MKIVAFLYRVKCAAQFVRKVQTVTIQRTPLNTLVACSFTVTRLIHTQGNLMAFPDVPLRWDYTVDDILAKTDELIASSKAVYDSVGALKKEDVTPENTIKRLAHEMSCSFTRHSEIDFYQHVFTDSILRDASVTAVKKLSEWEVELSMRQDVFDNLVAVRDKGVEHLSDELKRLLDRLILDGKRNGLHMPKNIQDEVKQLKKEMSNLSIDFCKHLNEEMTVIEFTEEDLVGVSDEFLKSLERTVDGKVKVTLKYPHYFPCIKKCRNPETRRIMQKAFNSRCVDTNTKILEDLIRLRHKKAVLLGYENHAAYVLERRMAKTPAKVSSFLTELAARLQPLREKEVEQFLQYKKEDCENYGYEYDGKINNWDMRYYMSVAEERIYSVDHEKLREYFPMQIVTKGLFHIYQELLSVEFQEVPGASVWHPDVRMFSVTDKETQKVIGYFYMDMHPRDGKYGHAACFPLQPGCLLENGTRQVPIVAVVCNFTKPTADRPALLEHDEVETYFHEFGHVMHHMCSETETAFFSGTSVESDFIEAPSQMLENWCWNKVPLRCMSSHFESGEPIPDNEVEKLAASRHANAGFVNLRQILLGTFDQRIHSCSEADTAKLYSELCEEILGFPAQEGTNMPASFDHLASSYDAQYYGYMWSEVFSIDMFMTRFHAEGVMNPKTGMDYRNCILRPGGSQDAVDMLRNFLGRDPNQDAFLKSKGLEVKV